MSKSTIDGLVGEKDKKVRWFSTRRSRLIGAGALLAVVFGGGGFAIANALSSSPPASANLAPGGPHDAPRPPLSAFPGAFGTVTSVGSNTFVVRTRTGSSVTVAVSSSTSYFDPSVTNPSFSDVKTGGTVAVSGPESNGVVQAKRVVIGVPRPGGGAPGRRGFGHGAAGTVSSVGSNSFVVKNARTGTSVTVDVSASTTYVDSSVSTPSFSDVKAGSFVLARGTTTSSGVIDASTVIIGGFGGGGFPGGFGGFGGSNGAGNSGTGSSGNSGGFGGFGGASSTPN